MLALHDPARHEPLTSTPWSATAARAAVRAIAADALACVTPDGLWPAHPLDDPATPEAHHLPLYHGAGGVIWALQHLRRVGALEDGLDSSATIATLVERNRVDIADLEDARGSFFLGDVGLLLLHWQSVREATIADALFAAIEANLHNKTQEALWGAPGSLIATLHMAQATDEPRWREQLERGLRILWGEMVFDESLSAWLWVQDMYQRKTRYLGAGHGFAGNLFTVLHGAKHLPRDLVDAYVARALQSLSASAVHEGPCINWPPLHDADPNAPRKWLMQDCHGAPGIVCRLAEAPRTPDWDALLWGAGEATWLAGPLEKGVGLCHGTAGNGYALLKLWRRTGDAMWLDRARAFAMHAIEQVGRFAARTGQTRHSLWTGDVGAALFAWGCIEGDARYPMLDIF